MLQVTVVLLSLSLQLSPHLLIHTTPRARMSGESLTWIKHATPIAGRRTLDKVVMSPAQTHPKCGAGKPARKWSLATFSLAPLCSACLGPHHQLRSSSCLGCIFTMRCTYCSADALLQSQTVSSPPSTSAVRKIILSCKHALLSLAIKTY